MTSAQTILKIRNKPTGKILDLKAIGANIFIY